MSKKTIQPEDVLPDGVDQVEINGCNVRKGTIAAFLGNIKIFEASDTDTAQKQVALLTLKKLAPRVIALGLHQYVIFKNPQIQQILLDADIG